MHCVPFDMMGAGGSQIPESCSVLGCIGQQGFISWHRHHQYLSLMERYSHSLVSIRPSKLCVMSTIPPPSYPFTIKSSFSVPRGADISPGQLPGWPRTPATALSYPIDRFAFQEGKLKKHHSVSITPATDKLRPWILIPLFSVFAQGLILSFLSFFSIKWEENYLSCRVILRLMM